MGQVYLEKRSQFPGLWLCGSILELLCLSGSGCVASSPTSRPVYWQLPETRLKLPQSRIACKSSGIYPLHSLPYKSRSDALNSTLSSATGFYMMKNGLQIAIAGVDFTWAFCNLPALIKRSHFSRPALKPNLLISIIGLAGGFGTGDPANLLWPALRQPL